MPYLVKLIEREYATTCPDCLMEGGSSVETQEFEVENGVLTEYIGWECMYCGASWWQTIRAKIGKTISNKVKMYDH